jgi:hypothetical protein
MSNEQGRKGTLCRFATIGVSAEHDERNTPLNQHGESIACQDGETI